MIADTAGTTNPTASEYFAALRTCRFVRVMIDTNKGKKSKPRSEETKKKIAETILKAWEERHRKYK